MATINKHGEIGQIDHCTFKLCYCYDGKILRNEGNGWKLYKRYTGDLPMTQVYKDKVASRQRLLDECPIYSRYIGLMRELFPFKTRGMFLYFCREYNCDIAKVTKEINWWMEREGKKVTEDQVKEIIELCKLANEEIKARKE